MKEVIVRGIDVGTQRSHYADVKYNGDSWELIRMGTWRADLPGVDAVFIEFPDAKWFGRANVAVVINISLIAANIALREKEKTETVRPVQFSEWAGKAAGRAELDAVFVKLISGAKRRRGRIYVGEVMTNEHIRDSALIAVYGCARIWKR